MAERQETGKILMNAAVEAALWNSAFGGCSPCDPHEGLSDMRLQGRLVTLVKGGKLAGPVGRLG